MKLLKKQIFCKNYKNEAKNFVFNTLRRVFLIDINICIESDGACTDKCRPSFFYYTGNQLSAFYTVNSMFMNCFYRNVLSESSSNEAFWLYFRYTASIFSSYIPCTHCENVIVYRKSISECFI